MFYQCPKCKRYWQYPIPKCPDCFLPLERTPAKKARVIGVSKVNIPTILHPIVPYSVLLLENEQGNRWVQKTTKEYKINDDFADVGIEQNLNKNTVAIQRIKYDIPEAIEKIIPLKTILKEKAAEAKILILPTLISPSHPHLAENTNPDVLASLIELLLQKGVKSENVKVASQSFDAVPIEVSAKKSGLLDVCIKNQITPLDLAKTNFAKQVSDDFSFEVSSELFDNDLIINLPTLNLHPKSGVKGATENLFKFLHKDSYLVLKYLFDGQQVFEKISKILPNNILTIGEAISVQKTNKFTVFLGLILSSFNMLNLDRVFAEICMLKPLPEYLKKTKIEDIPVKGRQIKEVQFDVEHVH